MTAQPSALITTSADRPFAPPTSVILPSTINSSPWTMELEWSIVTSEPFFMSIEATDDTILHVSVYFFSAAVAAFASTSRTAMPSFSLTSLSIRFSTSGFSFNHSLRGGEIEQVTLARNAFAVHDVELTLAKRRRNFVLRDLNFRAISDDTIAVLDGADAANVESQRRVKLEGAATGSRFGIAEHDPYLLADLVDEDKAGV